MKGGDRSLGRAEHCSLDHSPEVFFSASASLFASKYMDVCVSVFFFRLKAKFRGLDRGNGALEQDVKSTYVYCIYKNIENVFISRTQMPRMHCVCQAAPRWSFNYDFFILFHHQIHF